MSGVAQRKRRSDKKKDIKPTLSLDLKDSIHRLSYITNTPIKDVAELLCIDVMSSQKTIIRLARYFKRSIKIGSTMYMGSNNNEQYPKRIPGMTDKITIRFKQAHYDYIYDLSYALGVSASRVVAIMLQFAMDDLATVNRYIVNHLEHELTDNQLKQLKELIRYVNSNSNNHLSWAAFLSGIVNYSGGPVARLKEMITKFLDET